MVLGLKLQAVQGITSIYSLESKYVLAGKKDLKRCIPGSTGPDNGPCTLCIAGKYKASVGSMPCTDCNAGSYSEDVGATSATACLDCPGETSSPAASSNSTACVNMLPAGWTIHENAGTCINTYNFPAGTYSTTANWDMGAVDENDWTSCLNLCLDKYGDKHACMHAR
jgi:hypothetical protein